MPVHGGIRAEDPLHDSGRTPNRKQEKDNDDRRHGFPYEKKAGFPVSKWQSGCLATNYREAQGSKKAVTRRLHFTTVDVFS